jgi:autotransporter passenger strand-loop-strand repeat protein
MITVSSGQTQTISKGQIDSDDTVSSGGSEVVESGGISRRPIVDGGSLTDGGLVTGSHVSGGGTFSDSGGAFLTTVGADGIMYIEADGTARASRIESGGTIYDGGTADRTVVDKGGTLNVGGPVTISGTTSNFVGSADRTVLRGGTEYVLSGTDTNTRIFNGGTEHVESGGTASNTIIRRGGELIIESGGVASDSVIDRGGLELVQSGGITNGATINRGGTLEFDASSTGITQDVGFGDAGRGTAVLKLDAPATTSADLVYDGTISGFDSPKDQIDLAGLGFVSGKTTVTAALSGSNTILTVTNGSETVALTLAGDRTSDSFAVSADSGSGTTITDQSPWGDSPFGWLGDNISTLISDFGGSKFGDSFQHLVSQIENWDSPRSSDSDSTGDTSQQSPSPPGSAFGFDAGWKAHFIETLASFVDDKGGPSQSPLIQAIDQTAQTVLAGNGSHHG